MLIRTLATALALTLALPGLAQAAGFTTAQCSLNADKSRLSLVVSNDTDTSYACTASCKYTLPGARALQTFSCNYALGANTAEATACAQDGAGANHFDRLLPTKYVCQPR